MVNIVVNFNQVQKRSNLIRQFKCPPIDASCVAHDVRKVTIPPSYICDRLYVPASGYKTDPPLLVLLVRIIGDGFPSQNT